METFLNLGFIALGSFTMIVLLLATYVFLPQQNLKTSQVKIAINFTNAYRAGGFKKFAYFAIPVVAFLFFSFFGGLFLLIAAVVGVVFNKRYQLLVDRQPQEPLRATVIDPA